MAPKDISTMVEVQNWFHESREKEELEDMVKQKEKRLLRLQQVYINKTVISYIYVNRIIFLTGIYLQKCLCSEKPSRLSWESIGFLPKRTSARYFHVCVSVIFQPRSKDQGARIQLVAKGPQDLPNLMFFWTKNEQYIPWIFG